jgi:competence protein ComEC
VQAAPLSALAILAGVAAGVCLDVGGRVWLAALTVAWIGACVAFLVERRRLFAWALAMGFAGAGGSLGHRDASVALDPPVVRQTQPDTPGGCASCADGPWLVEGRLRDDAELTEFGAAFTIDLTRVEASGRLRPSAGGVRLSVGGQLAARQRDDWRGGRLVRAMATLRRPQAYSNFGTPDQESAVALRGIRLFGSVKSAALVEVVGRGSRWREAGAAARARIRRLVEAAIGARDREAAAIVVAVLIGDRAGLTPDLESRLQRAGTFHVIAISGGNIAILVGAALWTLKRLGLSPRTQAACALGAIVCYAGIASGGSSVARAALAASLYLVARTLDHRAASRTIVAVTAGVLLLARPLLVLDAGFWLTFVASIAILEQAASLAERLSRACRVNGAGRLRAAVRGAVTLLAATLVAEASLAPIVAFTFAQVTAAGLALNFLAIPLMSVVQMAGIAVVVCGAIHPVLTWPAGSLAILAARGITESARAVELAPWSAPHVPPPPLWLAVLIVAAWWSAWWLPDRRLRRAGAGLWVCGMLTIVAGWPVWPTEPARWLPRRVVSCATPSEPSSAETTPDVVSRRRWLRVTFLDVAQGSATLIRFPDDSSLLVDAGGAAASRFDVGARVVAPALWALGLRRLGAIALTHGDVDHIGGAGAVLEDFRPRDVWEGVPVATSEPLRQLALRAASLGSSWTRMYSGAARSYAGVAMRVWHPPPPDWERPRVRNDDSIVIELRWGDVSIVLPGDIGSQVEAGLAPQLAPARLRVLLAAHHGSRQSSSAPWLDALAPRLAVVSAGRDNRFGHPAPAVLDRLAVRKIQVLRTDRDGAIQLDTDGRRLRITTCGGLEQWMDS